MYCKLSINKDTGIIVNTFGVKKSFLSYSYNILRSWAVFVLPSFCVLITAFEGSAGQPSHNIKIAADPARPENWFLPAGRAKYSLIRGE